MKPKSILKLTIVIFFTLISPLIALGQTIGVFYDENVPQIKFAAEDVKKALESKSLTVQMLQLSTLDGSYSNQKIVIALATNTTVTGIMTDQGGSVPTGLGAQAYALRTTTTGQKSFWVLGGDVNGAMYGGIQMSENILFNGLGATYNEQESPTIARRGVKLNLPFDKANGTYGARSDAKDVAIANVWDMTFWSSWFDEMARNRYNVVSIWNNHHFTSMIKMPDYPNVAIQNVTDNNGNLIKTMTMDQKIAHWKGVMKYAHDRGFDFFLFNWNTFVDNALGKYGIVEKGAASTNVATKAYMRKCMSTLWETYPDLDGFGVTLGEAMSGNDANDEKFLADTYGEGTVDYAKNNPDRKIRFIHRWHLADFDIIKADFVNLFNTPNITFEMSYKYSLAHMYSTPTPARLDADEVTPLLAAGLKTNLTVRNDDFYYLDWGNPNFARDYIGGMLRHKDYLLGFYMGSDGYTATRNFHSKNPSLKGMLEVKRNWYMNKIWGRIAYNPNTSDQVFKNFMGAKYTGVSGSALFDAWKNCSLGITHVGELITGFYGRDNQWWPEACQARNAAETADNVSAFLTINDFARSKPALGSPIGSIPETAAGTLSGKKSSLVIANEMEASAKSALVFANAINVSGNSDLDQAISNIKAMSYLSIYYSYKIRGAVFKLQTKTADARTAMGTAYCWWIKYSTLMDNLYIGMIMPRTQNLSNFASHNASVLKEFTDLGGVGIPPLDCETTLSVENNLGENLNNKIIINPNPVSNILNVSFTEGAENREIKIFNTLGQIVYNANIQNVNIQIDVKKLNIKGVVIVQIIEADGVSNHKVIIN